MGYRLITELQSCWSADFASFEQCQASCFPPFPVFLLSKANCLLATVAYLPYSGSEQYQSCAVILGKKSMSIFPKSKWYSIGNWSCFTSHPRSSYCSNSLRGSNRLWALRGCVLTKSLGSHVNSDFLDVLSFSCTRWPAVLPLPHLK